MEYRDRELMLVQLHIRNYQKYKQNYYIPKLLAKPMRKKKKLYYFCLKVLNVKC